jgi:hypothetical protein
MVKYSTAATCLVAATCITLSNAFTPTAFVPKTATGGSSKLWIPPIKMAAGGAEKAYGEEYYEGERHHAVNEHTKDRRNFLPRSVLGKRRA